MLLRFNAMLDEGACLHWREPSLNGDDVAFLQYTGGTTGVSRAPRCCIAMSWPTSCSQTPGFSPCSRLEPGSRSSSSARCRSVSHLRADGLLHARARAWAEHPDPQPARSGSGWEALCGHRINVFPAVNTLFNALANDARFRQLDFSELVISNGGGMAAQQATAERWLQVTGCPVVEAMACPRPRRWPRSTRWICARSTAASAARAQHRDLHPE